MAAQKRRIVLGIRHPESATRFATALKRPTAASTPKPAKPAKPAKPRAKPLAKKTPVRVAPAAPAAIAANEKKLARLKFLTREILVAKGVIRRASHAIGKMLIEIQARGLYRHRDHEDFESYLARDVHISRQSAYRYMRIAGAFNQNATKEYGVKKLEALLQYAKTAGLKATGAALLKTKIPVTDDSGKTVVIPFAKARTSQLRAATKTARLDALGGIPKSLAARAKALEAALPDAPPGISGYNRVTLARGSDGSFAVNFNSIPVSEVGKFLRVVREHLG